MATAERMTTSEKIVEAVGLTKVFSDFWLRAKARAVDGIDFEIRRGEVFGLLGPNGSGKSTTIKMILGLLHKTKGRLLVFGREPSDVTVKKRIGYLPEESYMYRFLNPQETLDYYAKLFGIDRRERTRRVGELLEMVGLSQVRHRAVGEFSKGMTRRLGLAQALINDPEFLILDEPTSGLDPVGTKQVKDLLIELGRRGKTILLSSHLLDEVEDVCTRMVVLYGGKIRAGGTADELLTDTSRTVLTTQRLSPDTIARIDQVLQELQGIGVDRVDSPREKLEDFFMDLVEKARQEQVATSGAQHGGQTAAFLVEKEPEDGGELIEDLTREKAAVSRSVEIGGKGSGQHGLEAAPPAGPKADVLQELIEERTTPAKPTAPSKPAEPIAKPKDVDASVIDDLLGGGDDDRRGGASR
ncbi:MAG: ABC transporter ATP-binding protein [Phycisphaerae bacterium]|jgi:ABC-2 type transport system ATP-binding protein|nr:ABC transporter ATP-binding protein [Phycisphaerae bacterium]